MHASTAPVCVADRFPSHRILLLGKSTLPVKVAPGTITATERAESSPSNDSKCPSGLTSRRLLPGAATIRFVLFRGTFTDMTPPKPSSLVESLLPQGAALRHEHCAIKATWVLRRVHIDKE